MPALDLPHLRLQNQRLAGVRYESSVEALQGLAAIQAQDYAGAKWALAQRTHNLTEAELDRLFNAGAILRTHLLRPTWHFVAPADIRWMLALTAPRVHAANAYYYRQLELDQTVFTRTNALMEKALQGGRQLTRPGLAEILTQGGIDVSDRQRLSYIMMQAELDGLLCSGALRGKQHTYTLLEERVPAAPALYPEEALAELARRYFNTRGPASVQDLSWWSGLSTAEAALGLESVRTQLLSDKIDGRTFWFSPTNAPYREIIPTWHLLPNNDEYISSYKDRRDVVHPRYRVKIEGKERLPYSHMIFVDGLLVGSWQREFMRGVAVISAEYLTPISPEDEPAYTTARQHFSQFLGKPVVLDER